MCGGGQRTTSQIHMVGGAKDEHTLSNGIIWNVVVDGGYGETYMFEGSICLYAKPAQAPQ